MSFWKEVFSASRSQSWGRVHASIVLGFVLLWVSYLIYPLDTEHLDKLGNIGIFLTAGGGVVSVIYGLSKGLDTYKDIKTNKPEEIKPDGQN